MRLPFHKSKGFTLIEILIYAPMLVLITGALVVFLLWMLRLSSKTQANRETFDTAARVVEVITNEVRDASAVYTSTTTNSQLSLVTSKYLPADEAETYIDFFLCGPRLCIKKEGEAPVPLSSEHVDIIGLTFTEVKTGGVSSVQLTVSAQYKNPSNRPEYDAVQELTTTASMRPYQGI